MTGRARSSVPRIGYVPYGANFAPPADRRRFVGYARARNLPFEVANPDQRYDLVVLCEQADITAWARYPHGKMVYDLISSFLAIPRGNLRQQLRGTVNYLLGRSRHYEPDQWAAIQRMCRRADAVVCTTEEQRRDILPHSSNVHIILDLQGAVVRKVKHDYRCGAEANLVWEGLPSNIPQLRQVRDALTEVARRRPVVLNLVTDPDQPRFLSRFGRIRSEELARRIFDRVRLHAWEEETCAGIICGCDLGIIPIDLGDPLVAGKPENKLLLLWRLGMPVVCSATPAYRRAMRGAGLEEYACQDREQWVSAIERLLGDEALRREAGQRGRDYAEREFGEARILERWDALFASLGFDFRAGG